jgi:hypothetical protein
MRTKPLGRGAEKLLKANPLGGTALREQSAVQPKQQVRKRGLGKAE